MVIGGGITVTVRLGLGQLDTIVTKESSATVDEALTATLAVRRISKLSLDSLAAMLEEGSLRAPLGAHGAVGVA